MTDTTNSKAWAPPPRFHVYDVDRMPVRYVTDGGLSRAIFEVEGAEFALWAPEGQGHATVAAALVAAADEAVDHLDAAGAATLTAAVDQLAARLADVAPVPYLPAVVAS